MTQNLEGQLSCWLESLCRHFHLPAPKFSLGQPVIVTWYSEDNHSWMEERGYVVGVANLQKQFFADGWYYSVWITESSSGMSLYASLDDWTPENELTPWEV